MRKPLADPGRRCERCSCILSRYNGGALCAPCERQAVEALVVPAVLIDDELNDLVPGALPTGGTIRGAVMTALDVRPMQWRPAERVLLDMGRDHRVTLPQVRHALRGMRKRGLVVSRKSFGVSQYRRAA